MVTTQIIPIRLETPQVSSNAGNAYPVNKNLPTSSVDAGIWGLVFGTDGAIFGYCTAPSVLAASPNAKITLVLMWNNTAASKNCKITVASKFANNGASGDQALTQEAVQTVSVPTTAYQYTYVTIPLTTPPSVKDEGIIKIVHLGSTNSETVLVDTIVVEAWLEVDTP